MEFAIQTLRGDGSVAMDGYNKAGIYLETISIWYGTRQSDSKVYLDVPAGSLFFLMVGSDGAYTVTVGDDGLGHAKLIWTYSQYGTDGYLNSTADTTILVFARKVNQPDLFGAQTFNNDGDLLMDYTHPVPQYAGSVQPDAKSAFSPYSRYDAEPGYSLYEHTAVIKLRTGNNRMVMVSLPDSAVDKVWYCCSRPFLRAGETEYVNNQYVAQSTVTLIIMAPTGKPYKVPTLHVFSLDGPLSGGGTFGVQYLDQNTNLVYDSSAENITIRDQTAVTWQGMGQPEQSLSLSLPAAAGVVLPWLQLNKNTYIPADQNGNTIQRDQWNGMWQRRGNILYYKVMDVFSDVYPDNGNNFGARSGVPRGSGLMVVDLQYLNPSYVTGIP